MFESGLYSQVCWSKVKLKKMFWRSCQYKRYHPEYGPDMEDCENFQTGFACRYKKKLKLNFVKTSMLQLNRICELSQIWFYWNLLVFAGNFSFLHFPCLFWSCKYVERGLSSWVLSIVWKAGLVRYCSKQILPLATWQRKGRQFAYFSIITAIDQLEAVFLHVFSSILTNVMEGLTHLGTGFSQYFF